VWNPHSQKNILALEKIQNRRTRWICGSRFNSQTFTWSKSSNDCCNELHWPPLSTCQKYLSVATMYDILHHHISLDFFSFSSSRTIGCTPSRYYANTPLSICIDICFLQIVYISGTVSLFTYFLYPTIFRLDIYCIIFCGQMISCVSYLYR